VPHTVAPERACGWRTDNLPADSIGYKSHWRVTIHCHHPPETANQPGALDEPVARPYPPRSCRAYIGVEYVRFVGCKWSFFPQGDSPLETRVIRKTSHKFRGKFLKVRYSSTHPEDKSLISTSTDGNRIAGDCLNCQKRFELQFRQGQVLSGNFTHYVRRCMKSDAKCLIFNAWHKTCLFP
jgi:hypothetical protein